jgi:hypothetical protein
VEVSIVGVVLRAGEYFCPDDYSSSSLTVFLSPQIVTWLRRTSARLDPHCFGSGFLGANCSQTSFLTCSFNSSLVISYANFGGGGFSFFLARFFFALGGGGGGTQAFAFVFALGGGGGLMLGSLGVGGDCGSMLGSLCVGGDGGPMPGPFMRGDGGPMLGVGIGDLGLGL